MIYKLCKSFITGEIISVLRLNVDNSITLIPMNEENTDYQAYLTWLDEGNTPLPAENN